jgi:hypothetical protein
MIIMDLMRLQLYQEIKLLTQLLNVSDAELYNVFPCVECRVDILEYVACTYAPSIGFGKIIVLQEKSKGAKETEDGAT